jgi:large subunit ribosomal protein L15
VAEAIRKAGDIARQNLLTVSLKQATIPHEVLAAYGGARVLLRPASPGTGVIAGKTVRAVLESAGVKDVLSKSLGSKNAANVAKATLEGAAPTAVARGHSPVARPARAPEAGGTGAGNPNSIRHYAFAQPAPPSRGQAFPKTLGHGESSGHGKTSTRGGKGQTARSGGSIRIGFEGGQMPLIRRIPKRGFNNARFAPVIWPVNVGDLNRFEDGTRVDPAAIQRRGTGGGPADGIKILGQGEVKRKLTVCAHAFSAAARAKIEAAGGTCEQVARRPAAAANRRSRGIPACSAQSSEPFRTASRSRS